MPSSFRYDFVRTMKSKSVVVSIAVLVIFSFAMVPLIKLSTSPGFYSGGGTAVVGYASGSEFSLLGYSYNAYGQPVEGTQLNLTLSGPGRTLSYSVTTNSSGLASWVVPSSSQNFFELYSGGSLTSTGTLPSGLEPGDPFSLAGQNLVSVEDPANSSRRDALFLYVGPNGTTPSMYEVRFNYTTGPGNVYTLPERSQTVLLGKPSSCVSTFLIPEVPRNATTITLEVFGSNGTAFLASTYPTGVNGGGYNPPTPEQSFSLFTSTILVLVVPLMAILVAYNSYGKDKATGVLESVLSRPVTRRGLAASRYISFVCAIGVALVVTMGVMELISQSLLGGILPLAPAASMVGALVIEATAFIGIMMLLAHFSKSQGNMLLFGIGAWIVLDFFWSVFVFLAAAILGVQVGTGNYLGLEIRSSFLNPAQFYSLVSTYLNGLSESTIGGGSIPISPATYGVTPLTLALAAAFWVLVPLAALLYVSSRRD